MLKINHHHKSFHLPQFSIPHSMQLSPVALDDDELTLAIENDPIDHDNNWQLSERPDPVELAHEEATWEKIIDDVRNDPEWFKEDQDLVA
jgi:hypothetical protein